MSDEKLAVQSVLGIDSHVSDAVLPKMSELSLFSKNSDGGRIENKDLFMFAFAVGVHAKMPIPIASRMSGGYIRTSYLSDGQTVLMRAVHFARSDFEDSESLRDAHETYSLAEEYVNGGFQIIEGDLDQNMGSEELATAYIQELDTLYEQYTGKTVD